MEVCVGDFVKFCCWVEGDFFFDIKWFVDGDKIKEGGRFDFRNDGDFVMLRIFEISVMDEGEY